MQKSPFYLLLIFFSFSAFAQEEKNTKLHLAIDSIVSNAISKEAFPGCVIYASSGDSVHYFKAHGFHTYDSLRAVKTNHLYDLASITKMVGGTLAMMKLYECGLIELDAPIGQYIQKLGDVGKVTVREAMSHQGGLHPWIPYHQEIRKKDGRFKRKYVSTSQSQTHHFQLSDSLFLHRDFYQYIKKSIRKSTLAEKKYRYSGLFFYLIPELVYQLTDTTFSDYLKHHFYDPLEAKTLGFMPLQQIAKEEIVPTEIDTFFRKELIHGQVHDEGAIMMQGVSANAGLFSNAEDLSKVLKLLLYEGRCNGKQLLAPQTVALFTSAQYPNNDNRRGIGFDKPLLKYNKDQSSVAQHASYRSFGHTGYTGTLAWVDPENDLLFIFLSNRVYPSREHKELYRLNVRPTIHQMLYDYLEGDFSENVDTVEKSK